MARAKKSDTAATPDNTPPTADEEIVIQDYGTPPGDLTADAGEAVRDAETADPVVLAEPDRADERAEPLSASGSAPSSRVPETPERRRSGFFPTILGGAISAGLGAGAVLYAFPEGWRSPASADLSATLAAQSDRIDALTAATDAATRAAADSQAAIDALGTPVAGTDPQIDQRLSLLDTALSDLAAGLAALETRLITLEKRPLAVGTGGSAGSAAVQQEIAALRQMVEDQRGSITASEAEIAAAADAAAARIKTAEEDAARLRTEAEQNARAAMARAALSHVQAALENGASMEGALADLAAAGVIVPPELAEQATGVPSLSALRAAYPDAARDALTLSLRDTAGEGALNRIGAFLRSQTGARSLTPRAGDDPDAVLSRAEAALGTGDLSAAVAELSGLPETGRARMSEWIALAERRIAATTAVASLAAGVN